MKTRITLLLILALQLAGNAQENQLTATITGSIVDAQSGKGLTGVHISLEGQDMGTISDSEGNFTLTVIDTGQYRLSFSYLGYEKKYSLPLHINTG